jgi:hypothetical protein
VRDGFCRSNQTCSMSYLRASRRRKRCSVSCVRTIIRAPSRSYQKDSVRKIRLPRTASPYLYMGRDPMERLLRLCVRTGVVSCHVRPAGKHNIRWRRVPARRVTRPLDMAWRMAVYCRTGLHDLYAHAPEGLENAADCQLVPTPETSTPPCFYAASCSSSSAWPS